MNEEGVPVHNPEEKAVSLNLELATMGHALRGGALLASLLAHQHLPDEESERQVPHSIAAVLNLVDARLDHVSRVIRGDEDARSLWASHNATSPEPLDEEDQDVRLKTRPTTRPSPRPEHRDYPGRKSRMEQPTRQTKNSGPEEPSKAEEAPAAPSAPAPT